MNPLIRFIPPFLVRFFAKPYVAGDSLAAAIEVVQKLRRERGLLSTLDLLAEDIHEQEQADRNLATYLEMVEAAAAIDPADRPTLSLKPSSYTTAPLQDGGDAAGSLEALRKIAEKASACGVALTIDMESRHWTDFTLDALRQLHAAGHRDVGCVLQTRLFRTEKDLDGLPAGCRVRLVIGIYREPADVALTEKPAMKERMLEFAETLLRRGHYVEFASHDDVYVRRFVEQVVPRAGVGPDRFEVQMLYGVPRDRFLGDLQRCGIVARLYVPFALGWDMAIQYLRRRLDEYPAMVWLVTKNLLSRR
ncbi:MAG: proline dehydrogenase family protein [Planctomycetes bacterium]|nr:proline dehydrogenase family protein [Planctomycetota bacterium]MCB9883968.1 proline dehydrogenase family protein [Planctomycetota bacterium]